MNAPPLAVSRRSCSVRRLRKSLGTVRIVPVRLRRDDDIVPGCDETSPQTGCHAGCHVATVTGYTCIVWTQQTAAEVR